MARIDDNVDSTDPGGSTNPGYSTNRGDSTNNTTVESDEDPAGSYLRLVLIELPVLIYLIIKHKLVDRAACRHLLKLDDDHLNDIGVTREEVIWASKQKNATSVLQALVSARRKPHQSVTMPVETEPLALDAGTKTSQEINPFLLDLNDSNNHRSTSTNRPPKVTKDVSEE